MSKCEKCDTEVSSAFGCCFCQKAFCFEHVPPENHQCSKMTKLLMYWNHANKHGKGSVDRLKRIAPLIAALGIILLFSDAILASTYNNFKGLREPTYQEAWHFIISDQTDKNLYRMGEYTCASFAKDFRANALKAGFKCGYVLVLFENCSHAINCFNTTDSGLIFVEPQEDAVVNLKVGQPYWDRARYDVKWMRISYNDTVVGFIVTW